VNEELSLPRFATAAAALAIALACPSVFGADTEARKDSPKAEAPKVDAPKPDAPKTDPAKAAENRKKPLQRCDQLTDKAQLDCLQQARERVVEARNKREAAAGKGGGADTPKAK
jgi:hypothetical protein